jgi:Spy/CpxP family protein refolding chaperone
MAVRLALILGHCLDDRLRLGRRKFGQLCRPGRGRKPCRRWPSHSAERKRHKPLPQRKDARPDPAEHGALSNPGAAAQPDTVAPSFAKESVMKTWIKRTLIGLAAAGTLLGGLAVYAHSQARHFGPHFGWRAVSEAESAELKARVIERVGSRLELDAAQKARLGVLADRLRESRNALVANSAAPRDEMQALIAGASFDRARAQTLLNAQLGTVAAQSPALVAALADFYDSLRPEQQAKVREFLARRGGHGRPEERG